MEEGQKRLIKDKVSNNYTIVDKNRRMISAHTVLLALITLH